MKLRVVVSARASLEIEAAFDFISLRSSQAAEKWRLQLADFVASLGTLQGSHPLAPEAEDLALEIRTALFGKRQHKYRIFYTVNDGKVIVMHFRHGARKRASREDLDE